MQLQSDCNSAHTHGSDLLSCTAQCVGNELVCPCFVLQACLVLKYQHSVRIRLHRMMHRYWRLQCKLSSMQNNDIVHVGGTEDNATVNNAEAPSMKRTRQQAFPFNEPGMALNLLVSVVGSASQLHQAASCSVARDQFQTAALLLRSACICL